MTPKEKARELIGKFQHPPSALEHTECDCLHIDIAKECALIATNEVIDTLYEYHYDSASGAYEFWTEVKEELEKL
jgi:hypothetical protein